MGTDGWWIQNPGSRLNWSGKRAVGDRQQKELLQEGTAWSQEGANWLPLVPRVGQRECGGLCLPTAVRNLRMWLCKQQREQKDWRGLEVRRDSKGEGVDPWAHAGSCGIFGRDGEPAVGHWARVEDLGGKAHHESGRARSESRHSKGQA